jgi:hypothetical protein
MARMTLDQLVDQLRQMHGDKLQCVLLYGSAAAADAPSKRTDQNVLVLVDAINPVQLEALGATARAWLESGNPPPLELTVHEWARSADIFPMEYADILERHRVLHGTLPPGVAVSREDLRRQAEFEAMGKVLRLRQGIMHAGTDVKRQTELLRASHSTLMVIFRAVVRCLGEPAPPQRDALIARVAVIVGLDPSPFARVLALVRDGSTPSTKEAESLLFGTLEGMERLTMWLDTYEPDGAGPASADSPTAS